jgi:hypothetical protein
VFPKVLGESPGIHPIDSRNVVIGKPLGETLLSSPMRVFPRIGADNETRNMNVAGLKVLWQSVRIPNVFIRNAVVSNEGIGQYEDLSSVGRIRKGFGVSDHARVEDDFSGHGDRGSKRASFDWTRPVC